MRPTVKASTLAVYRYVIARYLKAFERKKIEAINENMVKTFVAMLLQKGAKDGKRGLSARTVGNILTIFKAICSYGEKTYGYRNQIRNVKVSRQKIAQERICLLYTSRCV